MNFRDEIPKRAFINAQIVQLAEQTESFRSCVRQVCDHYGISNYGISNPAHTAGLLYCLIVVPREQWWSQTLLDRLEKLRPQQFFRIKITPHTNGDGSVDDLIRHPPQCDFTCRLLCDFRWDIHVSGSTEPRRSPHVPGRDHA